MSAVFEMLKEGSVIDDMKRHAAWWGDLPGLNAEKVLRAKRTPYLFLIRQGERSARQDQFNFYVTFVQADLTIKHQPVVITLAEEGWYYENGGGGGPYVDASIDDVLHLVMHCQEDQCVPLVR